ncbi:MAG: glutaminase A [Pseudomonadota bacterium]
MSDTPPKPSASSKGNTPFHAYLESLTESLADMRDGKLADYIPELAKADPNGLAICVATIDGHVYGVGDTEANFSIQSVSKPFLYGHVLQKLGADRVLAKVGVEPTGDSFNAIVLDEVHNRPFNPMVNAGAIAVSGMIEGADGGGTLEARITEMQSAMSAYAGRELQVDDAVFRSENKSGDRNRGIAYLMKNSNMIARDPNEVLEVYFRQCSLSITCRDLAMMGAVLANRGIHPVTGNTVIGPDCVRDVLTIMMSCGMYDYAGGWAFEVGLPAKSGVSGAIVAVLPGQLSIAVWSPPLDEVGNSVRGLAACKRISQDFGLHMYGQSSDVTTVIRRVASNVTYRSMKTRSSIEHSALLRRGHRISILELQGALVFASAERLVRRVESLSASADYIIVSFRRVQIIDHAAMQFLTSLSKSQERLGMRLHFADIESSGLARDSREVLLAMAEETSTAIHTTTDGAIEVCEEAILAEMPSIEDTSRLSLSRIDLFAGLDTDQLHVLERLVHPMQFSAGEKILQKGQDPRLFFIIARGSVSIYLPDESSEGTRIGSMGPGQIFGEMGVLEDKPRSADVVADEPVLAYAMSIAMLKDLEDEDPAIPIQIYRNIAREFSSRMRRGHDMFYALR